VKKYFLSIFLATVYLLASARESITVVSPGENRVSISASKLPHAEIEISAHGTHAASLINHTTKKIDGLNLYAVHSIAGLSSCDIAIAVTATTLYSKRYLLFIHPTHHFW
jgi:hypothetical protein